MSVVIKEEVLARLELLCATAVRALRASDMSAEVSWHLSILTTAGASRLGARLPEN